MSAVSHNQAQVTSLVNYHRNEAGEAIAVMKEALKRKSISDIIRTARGFQAHSRDLRSEITAMMAELDAADAWFERERERISKECQDAINSKPRSER